MFDLWGVLYEGGPIFKDALEVLKNLHTLNKQVVLVSNTPFLNTDCMKNLQHCGLPTELYKTVLTAGELCMEYIQDQYVDPQQFYLVDKNYWDAWHEINQLHNPTTNIEEADAILCLAVPSNIKSSEQLAQCFDKVFQQAIKRNVKCICANPDLFAISSKELYLRPGLLSQRYQQLGGEVLSFGKPFPEIFIRALKLLENPNKVLMVGDTEYTDIQGASRHNIDTLLITSTYGDNQFASKANYFSRTLKW
jgi:HAD superfamily hydrolase (TIGR01459 family)